MTHANLLTNFPYSQISIGMDRALEQLDYISKSALTKYPPYNIISKDDGKYIVEIALSGFNKSDIKVEYFDSILTIKSKDVEPKDVEYIYKGISERSFNKEFKLSDDIEVSDVEMKDGMLSVYLERIIPESKKRRVLNIN
jgi:molecular chaperone IbpA